MKCQKCGASLKEGNLYCQKCGYEYQIVPDFEPEIENSIAQTMLNVGDSIIIHNQPVSKGDGTNTPVGKEENKRWNPRESDI